MKKMMSFCLIVWVLLVTSLNAQTTIQRSLYVSAKGDDNNNGRSEETPYKTLEKAMEVANAGVIKTITVIGIIEEKIIIEKRGRIEIYQNGADEILITGKPDASEEERAIINTNISVSGKVRFTHIRLTGGIGGGYITMGAGVVVSNTGGDGISYVSTLIMTDDAAITSCAGRGVAGGGTVIMSENTSITSNGKGGISVGTVTMSGNAKVSNNNGSGIHCDELTMSGNTEINGNRNDDRFYGEGGGVYVNKSLTMSGKARIINNTSTDRGGGVYVDANCSISGNATISGNIAKQGGGIYLFRGTITMEGGEISGNKAEYGAGVYIYNNSSTFNHKGGTITGNEADFVGGGVYVKSGAAYTAGDGKVIGNTSGDMGDDNIFRQ